MAPYLDTSALTKWYVTETRSLDLENYLGSLGRAMISALASLEFQCLLGHRVRNKENRTPEMKLASSLFEEEIEVRFLHVLDVENHHYDPAISLLETLKAHFLRSLDALHLAIASRAVVSTPVTADRVMATAGAALRFEIVSFAGVSGTGRR